VYDDDRRNRVLPVIPDIRPSTFEITFMSVKTFARRGHVTAAGLASAVFAVLLFAYMLHRAGTDTLVRSVLRIGVGGFAAILALSGPRLMIRTLTWRLCLDDRRALSFREAFSVMLIGEALGNAIPFAGFLTEPAKAALVRKRVPLGECLSALVVENIIYSVTVGLVIVFGGAAFLIRFRPAAGAEEFGEALRLATVGSVLLVALLVSVAYLVLRANLRPVTPALEWLARHDVAPRAIERQVARVEAFEARITGFTSRHRDRLLPILALEALFQVAGVAEVYVTLALVVGAGGAGFLTALILESTGRVVNIAFKFVPMRLGVDEAGAALITRALGLGAAPGVMLGLVRKARIFTWTSVGMLLLLHRGLTVGGALDEAEAAAQGAEARGRLAP
jgi:hypothetical protein